MLRELIERIMLATLGHPTNPPVATLRANGDVDPRRGVAFADVQAALVKVADAIRPEASARLATQAKNDQLKAELTALYEHIAGPCGAFCRTVEKHVLTSLELMGAAREYKGRVVPKRDADGPLAPISLEGVEAIRLDEPAAPAGS